MRVRSSLALALRLTNGAYQSLSRGHGTVSQDAIMVLVCLFSCQ